MSAAHIAHERVPVPDRIEPGPELRAARGRIVLDLQALGFPEAGDGCRSAHGVAGMGIARPEGPPARLAAFEDLRDLLRAIIAAPKGKQ